MNFFEFLFIFVKLA